MDGMWHGRQLSAENPAAFHFPHEDRWDSQWPGILCRWKLSSILRLQPKLLLQCTPQHLLSAVHSEEIVRSHNDIPFLSIYRLIYLYIHPSIHLSILPIYSIYSIYFIYSIQSIQSMQSIQSIQSIHLSNLSNLSIYPIYPIYPSIDLPIYPSVHLSICWWSQIESNRIESSHIMSYHYLISLSLCINK